MWRDSDEWRSYVSVLRRAASERRETARAMYAAGKPLLDIAQHLGVEYSTVETYLQGLRKRGRKPVKGHGTAARARRHYRHGEKPCPACREASRDQRSRRDNPDGNGRSNLRGRAL